MIYAGFWRRVVAYSVDIIPIFTITFLIFYFFLGFDQALIDFMNSDRSLEARKDFYSERNTVRDSSLIFWFVYCTILEASAIKGTFGKRLLRISVVNRNGDKISLKRSLSRNSFKIISAVPLFLGFLWVAFTKEKRGWHDLIAKTYVIKN
ncbi:hypothetical protein D1AOALGA4SA_12051 [Olavius algarvensis Delta 1 endosymbiont]|nr:hypothetical protein D1AOALGA4SA_12051 [Olavius algarvensis Delta 1 endosymbiont]